MEIKILDYDLSICKIENFSGVTLESEFCFLGMTDEECSLVCLTKVVPENIIECDKEWKVFRIQVMLYLSDRCTVQNCLSNGGERHRYFCSLHIQYGSYPDQTGEF